MIDTAQRVALYEDNSGLPGLTVADFAILLNGGTPEMTIDTSKRIALYPGRSGLPGATLQAIIDQEGGGGGGRVFPSLAAYVGGSSSASLTTPLQFVATPGTDREYYLSIYTNETTGGGNAPTIQSVTINGQTFDTTFRIGRATPFAFHDYVMWRVTDTDFVTPLGNLESMDVTVTSNSAAANTLTTAVMAQVNRNGGTNQFNLGGDGAGGFTLAWPISTIPENGLGLVFAAGATNAVVTFTAPDPITPVIQETITAVALRHSELWYPGGSLPNAAGTTVCDNLFFLANLIVQPAT